MMHKLLILCTMFAIVLSALPATVQSADEARIPSPTVKVRLWPDRAPIGDGTFEKSPLELKVYLPSDEKATGAAVVICPGGGYIRHVVDTNGYPIVEWLNAHGIAAILLEYRLPEGRSMVPLLDAQRTIRTVRANASTWKIDPHRIGILGFSAGGHVASTAGTHFDAGTTNDADPIERLSCRPDFMLLVYPVITMGEKTNAGSKLNLLGAAPKPDLVGRFSNETQVTRETPPAFLVHAIDDNSVPVDNSRDFVAALKACDVPVEYLELSTGGHGLNGNKGPLWEQWKSAALTWLEKRKVIGTPANATGLTTPSTHWPRWRGPDANNVADNQDLPLKWNQTENIRWSAKLPGWGTSSPVVYGQRVFVTSQDESDGKKSLLLLCFDREHGKELWRHDFGFGVNQRTHEKSNLAVNTPAVTEDAIYVAFGNADIARYSHDGKLIWIRRYLSDFGDPKMAWGYAISPLVVSDAVIFPWDHHTGPCFLIGLDKTTGQIAWKKDRPIGTAHATPLFVEHHGQQDILVPGKHRLTAFDAKTHNELWQYGEGEGPYNGEIIVSPVVSDDVVFLQLWRQSLIHAIRLNGDGKPPEKLWTSKNFGPVEPSLLYYRELLYALMDNGVLICLDGKSGAEQYRERLGGNCNSSPIASDGRIYLSNNDGKTFVVRAGTEFELLATNDLGERITASPAITGGNLVYRTDSHLGDVIRQIIGCWQAEFRTHETSAEFGNEFARRIAFVLSIPSQA